MVERLDGPRPVVFPLAAGAAAWSGLYGLLQAGFSLSARAGSFLREFMSSVLLFPDEYIERAVSTVFLDGKPVDDIDAARVAEGSLVALSAAMPGLVGAVMRRNSPYASFRESISHAAARERDPGGRAGAGGSEACSVRVRLFNSVMRDRGPEILSRGAIVTAGDAERALGAPFRAMLDAAGGRAFSDGELVLLRIAVPEGDRR